MSKRNNPVTSRLAHESIKESKASMYAKITKGLTKLRVGGQFEEVAAASGITPAQCWRRLSEMVDKGLCFNTGITRKTSSGRQAMVRQLVDMPVYEEVKEEKNVVEQPKSTPKISSGYVQESIF